MEWMHLYAQDKQPSEAEISGYVSNPFWAEINLFLRENYEIEPGYSYSGCSGQPGWNVKYQKSGRSLCTLYPMEGFFIALVVIGAKEQAEAELTIPLCDPYTQDLFAKSPFSLGGQWLMIHVTSEAILEDVKRLIQIRRKIKRKV